MSVGGVNSLSQVSDQCLQEVIHKGGDCDSTLNSVLLFLPIPPSLLQTLHFSSMQKPVSHCRLYPPFSHLRNVPFLGRAPEPHKQLHPLLWLAQAMGVDRRTCSVGDVELPCQGWEQRCSDKCAQQWPCRLGLPT